MKNKIKNQNPHPQTDKTETMDKIKSSEEIDEEYFRTNIPEGYETNEHEYKYLWSCEP